ncbi:MAG TPA: hypothetical protein VD813_10140 [Pseudonocardia sp.]|nr:hypothetical protein [Pseudonocardia sp.]
MSRTPRIRPGGAALLVGAVIATLALTGCGAGQVSQTANQAENSGGAFATQGFIEVLDARIESGDEIEGAVAYPRGGDAPIRMRIVNTGGQADRLVSASSPAASTVEITGETVIPSGIPLVVEGTPAPAPVEALPTGAAQPTGAAPTGTPGEAPTTPTPTEPAAPTAPTAAPEGAPTTAPEGGATGAGEAPAAGLSPTPSAGPEGVRVAQVVLTGLREDVQLGLSYELVLVFERAGEVRIAVPVANPGGPRPAGEAD